MNESAPKTFMPIQTPDLDRVRKVDIQALRASCHNIYTVAQWLVTVGAKNMREKSPKSRQASAQADVL